MLKIFKKLLNIKSNPQIIGFRGYCSHNGIKVIGRVTENSGLKPSEKRLGALQNAKALIKRYLSDPIPNIKVKISWKDTTTIVTTDENGMFSTTIQTKENNIFPKDNSSWLLLDAKLIDYEGKDAHTNLEILINGDNTEYGIISDIDDTILVSGVAKKLTLVYKTFTQDSHVRKPFEGVVELLTSFASGKSGLATNPIFYVSSSQWNLYDYLTEFMRINKFPKGVLLLKEIGGISTIIESIGNHSHKTKKITSILNMYPNLSFVMIGDSGQHDAAIYSEIIKKFPNRIRAVYIRDVTVEKNHMVTAAVKSHGENVPFVLIKTSKEAAEHATNIGLISVPEKRMIQQKVESTEG